MKIMKIFFFVMIFILPIFGDDQHLFNSFFQYYTDFQYDSALHTLLDNYPSIKNKGYASYLIGNCYLQRNKYSKALDFFIKASDLDKNYKYYVAIAKTYEKMNIYYRAVSYYKKSLDLQPGEVNIILSLISVYEKIGDFYNALNVIKNCSDERLIYHKGYCFYKLGNYDKAIINFKKVLLLDSTSIVNKKYLALSYFNKGKKKDVKNALDILLDLHKKFPHSIEITFYIGESYFILQQYNNAIIEYLKCINRENKFKYLALKKLVKLFYLTKQYRECIRIVDNLIKANSVDNISFYYYAKALEEIEQYDKAIRFMKQALKMSEIDFITSTISNIGLMYLKINDYRNALDYLNRVCSFNPDYDLGYYNLAVAYDKSYLDRDMAIELYKKFIYRARAHNSNLKLAELAEKRRQVLIEKRFMETENDIDN